MRFRCLFLGLAISGGLDRPPLAAVEIVASGISVPFYSNSGVLTHRLLAKQGTKAGSVQILRGVEVHYFSPDDSRTIVQKLETDEATWDERKQTLVGRGRIVVTTVENRLSGEGFDFALATSLLHLHRHFTMTNPEVLLTSDRATAELIVEQAGNNLKLRDVKRCEASGNLQIAVQPTATKKYGFEKVFSETAIFEGATQTIVLPRVSRTLSKGVEVTSQTLTIHLKDSAAPPSGSTPR